jgi:Ca2+-transporting ATPase
MQNWHTLDADHVVQELKTNVVEGLSDAEAARRLTEYGPNELEERGGHSAWQILRAQLTSIMVLVLIVAAGISVALGDLEDALVILAIVVLNTILGFTQEYRAERAMEALKQLAVPSVRVRRGGKVLEISARDLVPGDIVLLEAGNRVPGDGRLVESASMRVQEAALTGESEAVEKHIEKLDKADVPLGDRRNMAYMGTNVTYGRGVVVVTGTGMKTELGKVADLIQGVEDEPTPLQKRLDQLGKTLTFVALIIVAVVFVLGLVRGEDLEELLLTAVSLAVAAIPEALPAVVTIALALGAQRMLKRQALIRKLPAVETLGSVTVICSDKTGTLTLNRMTVTTLDVSGRRLDIDPNETTTALHDLADQPALTLLLAGGALANDSVEDTEGEPDGKPRVVGDPTEAALVLASARHDLHKPALERVFPRVAEIPFDSDRKRMTTVHKRLFAEQRPSMSENNELIAVDELISSIADTPFVAFTKGGVDSMLEVVTGVWDHNHVEQLTPEWRERVLKANNDLASEGMRVLGVGLHALKEAPQNGATADLEKDIILVGLVGMIDPARPEVREAVKTCKAAGIRPVMITGDHPLTAVAIARELGITQDRRAYTGQDLDRLSVEELEKNIDQVSVYARVSPEHKIKLVNAFQKRGNIVAMTGDGVNDAPALKQADIGVAMGITGTDVAKESAEMVLQDDNFATIVAAVAEGRVIYSNIRKFIRYILTGNFSEIFVMLIAPFLGMPLPLLPLQILWINLVTDGLPALALGIEPAERDVMRQPPHPPTESILGRGMSWRVLYAGILLGLLSLGVGYFAWRSGNPDWQTMVFTTLTFGQMAGVLAIRSERESLFSIGLLSNKLLLGAVVMTALLQVAVIYIPFLQHLFETVPLTLNDLLICVGLSLIMFVGIEIEQWMTRMRNPLPA